VFGDRILARKAGAWRSALPELSQAVRILEKVSLFHGLNRTALVQVAHAARSVELRPGAFFFRQGSKADTIYVLMRGGAKLIQTTPEGHPALLRFIGRGEVFGPTATLGDRLYPVSAQSVSECHALAWEGRTMVGLIEQHPRIAINVIEALTAHIEELRNRYHELATDRVERRVAHALLRLAEKAGWTTEQGVLIDVPLSRQDLAEMTGTTLYTVSRILRGWQRQGRVRVGRQRVEIVQPQRLLAVAQDWPTGGEHALKRRPSTQGRKPTRW
jgi:CRP-like cAMP-binding protein